MNKKQIRHKFSPWRFRRVLAILFFALVLLPQLSFALHPKKTAAASFDLGKQAKITWVADNAIHVEIISDIVVDGVRLKTTTSVTGNYIDADPTDGNHEWVNQTPTCGYVGGGIHGKHDDAFSRINQNGNSWHWTMVFDTDASSYDGCTYADGDIGAPGGDLGAIRDQAYWLDRTAVKYKNDVYKVYNCNPYNDLKSYDTAGFLSTNHLSTPVIGFMPNSHTPGGELIYTSGSDDKRAKVDTSNPNGKGTFRLPDATAFINLNVVENGAQNAATDAYKLDDTTIFVPCGIKVGTGGVNLEFPEKAIYKKPPQDSPSIQSFPDRKDKFFRLEGGNIQWQDWVLPTSNTSAKIETDANTPGVKFFFTLTMTDAAPPAELYGDKAALIEAGNNGQSGSTGSGTSDSTPRCESGGLSWVICPIINALADASDGMFNKIIKPLLATDSISVTPSDTNYVYQAWSSMRIYGNVLLVIGMLVIVFGQSIGGGLIDAYTAKKVLPRILAAAILVNLSIYIVAILVDITNLIGSSINSLLTGMVGPPGGGHIALTLNGGASGALAIGGLVGGVGIWALGSALVQPILLFILLPMALALLGVVVTIILRKGLIMLLIIVSPIAFALYCLPNTEQYFRKWWKLLFEALLIYPIIGLVFGIANIMAVTLNKANTNGNGVTSAIAEIISLVILIIPLFLIPYSFKLAGGVLGSLHAQLTGFGKKAQQGVLGNPNDANSMRNRAKRGMTEAMTRKQGQLVYTGRSTKDADGNLLNDFASRRRRAFGRAAGMFGNVDSRMSDLTAQAAKRREQLSSTGDDQLLYAATGWRSGDKYFNGKGQEISAGDYNKGKTLYGDSPYAMGQALSYQASKIQTDKDVANFRRAFSENAVANNWDDSEAMGVWSAATYPHKGTLGSEWYSKPTAVDANEATRNGRGTTAGVKFADVANNQGNFKSFIGDLHKTRQSFQLGQVRDQDWRAMADAHQQTEAKLAAGWGVGNGQNEISQDELDSYAMTDEVMNAMTSQGLVTMNPNGEVSVAGATAASQGVIEAMFKNRKYGTTQEAGPTGTDDLSVNKRIIYSMNDAANARGPGVSEGEARAAAKVHTATVTGDIGRTSTPRQV